MSVYSHRTGRPTLDEGPRTSVNRTIRFAPEELDALEANAMARGVPISVLVRDKLRRTGVFTMPDSAA